jgi:hypothetical protein
MTGIYRVSWQIAIVPQGYGTKQALYGLDLIRQLVRDDLVRAGRHRSPS